MITKKNAKEFIKRTSDFVWIEDRKILKDNDILDLMVEFAQEQVKLFAKPNVNPSLKDWIEEHQQEAWDKMGDTGNDDYTTDKMNWNEENYWFGYFMALENFECELLGNNDS